MFSIGSASANVYLDGNDFRIAESSHNGRHTQRGDEGVELRDCQSLERVDSCRKGEGEHIGNGMTKWRQRMDVGEQAIILRNGGVVENAGRCLEYSSIDAGEMVVDASETVVNAIESVVNAIETSVHVGQLRLDLGEDVESLVVLCDCRDVAHESEAVAESDRARSHGCEGW